MKKINGPYLAIDPGGRYNGYAEFEADGTDRQKGIFEGKTNFYMLLKYSDAKVVIMEEYELYPWKSDDQKWSQLHTVRIIGAVEYWCHITKRELVFQKPMIKQVGYMWAGMKNRHKHDEDAYVHGLYYLVRNKIRIPDVGVRHEG